MSRFLSGIPAAMRRGFSAAVQKVRGIADLRDRAIYIQEERSDHRERFVKLHELSHQVIPWHNMSLYSDDSRSLRVGAEGQEIFDREANFLAAELLFQGDRFRHRALDFQPTFEAAFTLAAEHRASRHATLWRFVEAQDGAVALLTYWPTQYLDGNARPNFKLGRGSVASPNFVRRYSQIDLPRTITADHEWAVPHESGLVEQGETLLECDGLPIHFERQSWWNYYSLFVLLRRRPSLALVGRLVRGGATSEAR